MSSLPESPSVARELVAHSGALRRLARDLVGRTDADDLVQDTAVRALRAPPPNPHSLFSWLSTVMHNLASNRRRGEQRRRQHEASAGGGSSPPADADAVQRDSVRAVTEALWALPEPYQSALVQRYFEELSPSRIAARSRVPVATVKSRLQRGLEMLRVELERREGRAWRATIGPALGLGVRSGWLFRALSVSSMSTLAKSGVVLAACAIAAFTWWVGAGAVVPPASAAIASANESATPSITPDVEKDRGAERAVVASESPEVLALAQRYEFELRARIVDGNGMAISGASLALAPSGCALALVQPPSDNDGRITVKWRGRVPAMKVAVGVGIAVPHTSLQEVQVAAGVPAELHCVAGVAPLPAQVRVDELGRQIVTMPDCSQGKADCRSCHQGMAGASLFEARGRWRVGLHPDATFGDLVAIPPEDPSGEPGDPDAVDDVTVGVEMVSSSDPGAMKRSIEGRVFGADGKPLFGVRVEVNRPDFTGGSTQTTADGSYRFAWPTPGNGPVSLRAGGGPEGLATRTIEVVDDHTVTVDLMLETGRTLRGRAIGSNGESLNGARVEYVAPSHDGDVATVGPDGHFAFANLSPGPARLLLWGVQGEKFPIAEELSVLPDSGEVLFDLRQRAAANGGLRVFVRGHDGEAPAGIEVRAWQVQTGRGASLDPQEDGGYYAHGLAAGFYRIEIGALASGFRDFGQHWVDGTAQADLGTVQLATPGRLVIEGRDNNDGLELYRKRADLDVRADEIVPWTRDVLLPAGRWVALWKRDGKVAVREFALEAGGTTTLCTDR
ncbi:MAG TPA: sigma-70 family RNA polymerase sigma factor [Planctomycetota bacterium]|nr:sigma-70 family RNA polymerase sigma factor [Planctomycetota bacterium]